MRHGTAAASERPDGSAGLAMQRLLTATGAEFFQFKAVRGITAVLSCNIVAFLAYGARQRNARTNIGTLLCHCSPFINVLSVPSTLNYSVLWTTLTQFAS